HFLLGLARLALALLHGVHDAAEFTDLAAGFFGDLLNLGADIADAALFELGKILPALAFQERDLLEPIRIKLMTAIMLEKLIEADAARLREAEQLALERIEAAIDRVKLLNQRFDAVVVEVKILHRLDNVLAQFLEAARLAVGELFRGERRLDIGVLQAAQLFI